MLHAINHTVPLVRWLAEIIRQKEKRGICLFRPPTSLHNSGADSGFLRLFFLVTSWLKFYINGVLFEFGFSSDEHTCCLEVTWKSRMNNSTPRKNADKVVTTSVKPCLQTWNQLFGKTLSISGLLKRTRLWWKLLDDGNHLHWFLCVVKHNAAFIQAACLLFVFSCDLRSALKATADSFSNAVITARSAGEQ